MEFMSLIFEDPYDCTSMPTQKLSDPGGDDRPLQQSRASFPKRPIAQRGGGSLTPHLTPPMTVTPVDTTAAVPALGAIVAAVETVAAAETE